MISTRTISRYTFSLITLIFFLFGLLLGLFRGDFTLFIGWGSVLVGGLCGYVISILNSTKEIDKIHHFALHTPLITVAYFLACLFLIWMFPGYGMMLFLGVVGSVLYHIETRYLFTFSLGFLLLTVLFYFSKNSFLLEFVSMLSYVLFIMGVLVEIVRPAIDPYMKNPKGAVPAWWKSYLQESIFIFRYFSYASFMLLIFSSISALLGKYAYQIGTIHILFDISWFFWIGMFASIAHIFSLQSALALDK